MQSNRAIGWSCPGPDCHSPQTPAGVGWVCRGPRARTGKCLRLQVQTNLARLKAKQSTLFINRWYDAVIESGNNIDMWHHRNIKRVGAWETRMESSSNRAEHCDFLACYWSEDLIKFLVFRFSEQNRRDNRHTGNIMGGLGRRNILRGSHRPPRAVKLRGEILRSDICWYSAGSSWCMTSCDGSEGSFWMMKALLTLKGPHVPQT